MTTDTAETDHEVESHRTRIPLWSLLFLVIGYPLSTGPVVYLLAKFDLAGTVTHDVIRWIYLPFGWLVRQFNGPLLREWLSRWEEFWANLAG